MHSGFRMLSPIPGSSDLPSTAKLGKCPSMPARESDLSVNVSSVERLGSPPRRRCSSSGVNALTDSGSRVGDPEGRVEDSD